MGLTSLTLNEQLRHDWRMVLEENGLRVALDSEERSTVNVSETGYLVASGKSELRLLEVVLKHRPGEPVALVMAPSQAGTYDRPIPLLVQAALQASGATVKNYGEKLAIFASGLQLHQLVQTLNVACRQSGAGMNCRTTSCPNVLTFERTGPAPSRPADSVDVYVVRGSPARAKGPDICLAIRIPSLIERLFGSTLRFRVLKTLRSVTGLREM